MCARVYVVSVCKYMRVYKYMVTRFFFSRILGDTVFFLEDTVFFLEDTVFFLEDFCAYHGRLSYVTQLDI